MTQHNYEIIGLKDSDPSPEGACTFGLILKDRPEYAGKCFIYENLTITDTDDGPMVSVGLVILEGGTRTLRVDMRKEDEELMIEIITQISNEIMAESHDE